MNTDWEKLTPLQLGNSGNIMQKWNLLHTDTMCIHQK